MGRKNHEHTTSTHVMYLVHGSSLCFVGLLAFCWAKQTRAESLLCEYLSFLFFKCITPAPGTRYVHIGTIIDPDPIIPICNICIWYCETNSDLYLIRSNKRHSDSDTKNDYGECTCKMLTTAYLVHSSSSTGIRIIQHLAAKFINDAAAVRLRCRLVNYSSIS